MKAIFIKNSPELKCFRKQLRKNQTDAERKFWGHLRSKRLCGLKFFRQYSVGPYILDFYCPSKKLVVELDGGQHIERAEYDKKRTKFLEQYGIHVIRFWDNEALNNIDGIIQSILSVVTPPNLPLNKGRNSVTPPNLPLDKGRN